MDEVWYVYLLDSQDNTAAADTIVKNNPAALTPSFVTANGDTFDQPPKEVKKSQLSREYLPDYDADFYGDYFILMNLIANADLPENGTVQMAEAVVKAFSLVPGNILYVQTEKGEFLGNVVTTVTFIIRPLSAAQFEEFATRDVKVEEAHEKLINDYITIDGATFNSDININIEPVSSQPPFLVEFFTRQLHYTFIYTVPATLGIFLTLHI